MAVVKYQYVLDMTKIPHYDVEKDKGYSEQFQNKLIPQTLKTSNWLVNSPDGLLVIYYMYCFSCVSFLLNITSTSEFNM